MSDADGRTPRSLSLSLHASPEQVMVGVETLQAFCLTHGIDESVTCALMLALEESGANIVNHAYQRDARRTFRVSAEQAHDRVTIELRDEGPPFDPLAPRPPPPDHDPDDPPIGGLGINLVRRAVDEVHYAREGAENVLRLVKRVPPPDLGAVAQVST